MKMKKKTKENKKKRRRLEEKLLSSCHSHWFQLIQWTHRPTKVQPTWPLTSRFGRRRFGGSSRARDLLPIGEEFSPVFLFSLFVSHLRLVECSWPTRRSNKWPTCSLLILALFNSVSKSDHFVPLPGGQHTRDGEKRKKKKKKHDEESERNNLM